MFPPGFPVSGGWARRGGRRRLGPGSGPKLAGGGLQPPRGRVRPAHPPPPRRAQPPFSCKNNLKKRP